MNQKEITIAGKQYPVVFDMQAIINFEEIANKSFFEANLKTLMHQVAAIMGAALAADNKSDITVEAIMGNRDLEAIKQITTAFGVVSELMTPFFEIPEVEPKEEKPADEQGDNQKN